MRPITVLTILALGALLSCRKDTAALPEELDVIQAEAMIQSSKDLQIIDVRSPAEHQRGHLKGDKLIPIDDFEKRMAEVPRDKPVLLYCAGGGRSEYALGLLKKQGYTNAVHMGPGFDGWKQAGKPFEK